MTDAPLISVALCTFNGVRFLGAQLDSVLAQDYPRFEVVAVDDASTDGTYELLASYAARDPRLRLHRNAANLGFRRNFETALGLCRGELLAPCDQDDVWRPDKLRLQERALGRGAAVFCDSALIDEAGRPLGLRLSQRWAMRRLEDPVALAFSNCVSGHALLLRRSLLARALPLPEHLFHDWWLAFVAAGADGIDYLPEPLVQYRQHGRTVTDVARQRRRSGAARPTGHRLATAVATGHRLRAFAALPGPGLPLYLELLRLWERWMGQFLAPELTLFLLRHRRRIFALRRGMALGRLLGPFAFALGLRARRLVRRRAYGAP